MSVNGCLSRILNGVSEFACSLKDMDIVQPVSYLIKCWGNLFTHPIFPICLLPVNLDFYYYSFIPLSICLFFLYFLHNAQIFQIFKGDLKRKFLLMQMDSTFE